MAKMQANEVAQSAPIAIGLKGIRIQLSKTWIDIIFVYQKSLGVPNHVNGQIAQATITIHKHFETC